VLGVRCEEEGGMGLELLQRRLLLGCVRFAGTDEKPGKKGC